MLGRGAPDKAVPRGPKKNAKSGGRKYSVRVTKAGGAMIIFVTRSRWVVSEFDEGAGRWALVRPLSDGLKEEVISVLLERIAKRAGEVALIKRVWVSGTEFAVLSWLSGAKPEPKKLMHRLSKAVVKAIEKEGKVDLAEAVRISRERLNRIFDKLP